ncbi:MAG: hypothetical protein IJN88_01715 [Clostridia bacterium]|nr:hypothetical protein [Clostridia bacterium]
MTKTTVSLNNQITTGDGSFKGWGTSLCWWANRVGGSKKLTRDAAELFFDKEKGLGLNIMRYNIGGGDDPTHTHIQRTDSMMPGFLEKNTETGELSWNYEADKRQLDVLEACYRASGEDAYVEAFSNSPPYFMTVSGCSSGHRNPNCNNLRRDSVEAFAEYLAHVTDYIQREKGIKVHSLAPMNEPYSNYWYKDSPKQEGCHVSPGKRQSELLVAVKRAMRKYALGSTDLTASDETNSSRAAKSFAALSADALSVIDRISTHTYERAKPKIGDLCRRTDIDLWMTETDWSSESGENAGEMAPALWLAEKIIEDMYILKPSAWVIWQIVASYISQKDYLGRRDMPCMFDLNKGYWGCAVAEMDSEEYILTQKYYAFGQFSRYIRPGMKILLTDKRSLCAYDEKAERLIIVAVNPKEKDTEAEFVFDNLPDFTSVEAVRTSGGIKDGEHWAEALCDGLGKKSLKALLKANSVTTFILTKNR